jgi:chlorite dismutase
MRPESKVDILAAHAGLPALPLTLEGSSVLHQMMRVRWAAWKKLSPAQKKKVVAEAVKTLAPMEQQGESALYSILGHKADLIFVHFRSSFEELKAAELRLSGLELWDLLEPAGSYLSVIELGLYDSTVKLYRALTDRGVEPNSDEWKREAEGLLQHQREAMRPRLFPKVPESRYLSFYPMDRRRGEEKNWYTLPIQERQRQMAEHGEVGRRYAGQVKQIISGSIGFDDWEWGVDLFADDPLVFKKLIYEMRFDEVSAVYATFGAFYVGVRCPVGKLGDLLGGELPKKE